MSTKTKFIFLMSFLALVIVGCVASMVIVLAAPKQKGILDVSIKYYSAQSLYTMEGETTITGLTSVGASQPKLAVPDGITTIKSGAFSGGSAKNITIPSSVTTLEAGAFANNSTVESITFKENDTLAYADAKVLKTIPADTFKNCINLKTLIIPSTVTSIANRSLAGCTALERLDFPCVLETTWGESNFYKLFGANPISIKTVNINGGSSIGQYAFYSCGNLENVTIADTVKSIGYYAFQFCSKIKSITIPASVTSIARGNVFSYCVNLEDIIVDEGNTYYNSGNGANCIIETATKTIISGGSKTIISENVEAIGDSAFYGSKITSITIPKTVVDIHSSAIRGCYSLRTIVVDKDNPVYNSGNGANCIIATATKTLMVACEITVIPEGVEVIASYAFFDIGITDVYIPASVKSIGSSAFQYCSLIKTIVVDENNTVFNSGNGANCIIETATNMLYRGCKTTVIPESVTSIRSEAFYGCTSLSSITIPKNVKKIGTYAFGNTGLVYAKFENTSNWFYSSSSTATSGTAVDVTNPSANAINLKSGEWTNVHLMCV